MDLRESWEIFSADPTGRLLVWQVPGSAARFLECFVEVQKHQTPYTTSDLFIVFDAPFEHSIQYCRAVKESLAGQYEATRDRFGQEGIAADWRFAPAEAPHSATGVFRGLQRLASNHQEIGGHVVAVLTPSDVLSDDAFAAWLLRAVSVGMPERVRVAVVDVTERSRLKGLIVARHKLVRLERPRIDALAAARETFAQEGVGPAAVFRNHLMGLMTLSEKGSAEEVKVKAGDALTFARMAQWPDQEVVIGMLVAGALVREKRFAEALDGYREARRAALQAAASGHPAGRRLVLQTQFGEAGVHLAAGDSAKAVHCYDEAARVAEQIPDLSLAIEATRMGSFCNARMTKREAAIERGSMALRLGEQLAPAARGATTLPLAAVDLLRVMAPDRVRSIEEIARRRDARIEKARGALEDRAAELEGEEDPRLFNAVEERFDAETAAAERAAAQELDALVTNARGPFAEVFARARGLLGEEWPLASPAALPRAPSVRIPSRR